MKLLVWPYFLCYDYSMDAVLLVHSILDVRLLLPLAGYMAFLRPVGPGIEKCCQTAAGRGRVGGCNDLSSEFSADDELALSRRDPRDRTLAVHSLYRVSCRLCVRGQPVVQWETLEMVRCWLC